ncbi:MAG: hypothetical protein V1808_01650 [Candidatus Daviesbacteria bacterium]
MVLEAAEKTTITKDQLTEAGLFEEDNKPEENKELYGNGKPKLLEPLDKKINLTGGENPVVFVLNIEDEGKKRMIFVLQNGETLCVRLEDIGNLFIDP